MVKKFSRFIQVVSLFSVIIISACATQKESVYTPPPERQKPQVARPAEVPPVPEAKTLVKPKTTECEEDTAMSMNRTGIETMPFMRMNFFDIDRNGMQDMIIGNKNGNVYRYKNTGDPVSRPWQLVPGYFDGVKAGAFSSPAMADFAGDGKIELIVGTGGFSSDSGKILFYRNDGDVRNPSWKKISDLTLSIGNDAAVTVADYDFDGKPDIIACNSEGKIFFFRNVSTGGDLRFVRDTAPPVRANFGMYAVPSAKKIGDRVVLAVGNSMGKLVIFEIRRNGRGLNARQYKPGVTTKTFASPAFANLVSKDHNDLVLADGDGVISYYESRHGDFSSLLRRNDMFSGRVFAGPACSPTISNIGGMTYMVIGNMDGTIKLFQYKNSSGGIPWTEAPGYFKGIKVKGFSRGVLTTWEGKKMLVVGQGNGNIRAFFDAGKGKPVWKEKAGFFKGVNIKEHSTPVTVDLTGDGRWQLISGGGDGRIYGYRVKEIRKGMPVWERIEGVFDNIKVSGFSSPAIVRDEKAVYLFVGQQDGRIRTFKADISGKQCDYKALKFRETDILSGVRMNEHSSPFVVMNENKFDIISGDYNGNLRHFLCSKSGT